MPTPVEIPNAWSILFEIEDQGPADGLTLQQSVERLVRSSVTLRARAMEIPQAQADVLTAGLYANPIVYADKQLIGYQPYSLANNPGGPAQYDVNVAYPFDVSGKRRARIEVASAAQRVVEALYQDAVRLEVDRLNDAFVDALSARLNLRTARDGLALVDEVQRRAAAEKHDDQTADDLRHHLQLQRQTLALALYDAEAAWRNFAAHFGVAVGSAPRNGGFVGPAGLDPRPGPCPAAAGGIGAAGPGKSPGPGRLSAGLPAGRGRRPAFQGQPAA